jgi:hypothetical protein
VAITIRVALAYSPTWYEPEFWSTHKYDSINSDDPYGAKPYVSFEVELDDTLSSIIDRAGTDLGLLPGPSQQGRDRTHLSECLSRVGFFEQSDDLTFDMQRVYAWPSGLPVALNDGAIEVKPWQEVTLRELLVSSKLGLIEGDVLRPYICPSMRQGIGPEEVEFARLTSEAVRAAYHALPAARETVDDIVRVTFLVGGWRAMMKRLWRRNENDKKA